MEEICNDTRDPSNNGLPLSERQALELAPGDLTAGDLSVSYTSAASDADRRKERDVVNRDNVVNSDNFVNRRVKTRRQTQREYKNYYVRNDIDRKRLVEKSRASRLESDTLSTPDLSSNSEAIDVSSFDEHVDDSIRTRRHIRAGLSEYHSESGYSESEYCGEQQSTSDVSLLPVESIHDLRASVGEYLAKLRLEKGKSIRDVSESTKVPVDVLNKLEIGDWSDLPAPVFLKGFIRAYVRFVGGAHHVGEERVAKLFGEIKKRDESIPIQIVGDSASELDSRRRFGLALFVFILVIIATITFSLLWGNGLDSKMRDIDIYGALPIDRNFSGTNVV